MTDIQIEHEEQDDGGMFFYAKKGVRLAEMTYVRSGEKLVIIDHTGVNEQLQGQGIAHKLLEAAVAWARATGTKLHATCSFAKAQFERDASLKDVVA